MNTKLVAACLNIAWWWWPGHGLYQPWLTAGRGGAAVTERPGQATPSVAWRKHTRRQAGAPALIGLVYLSKHTQDLLVFYFFFSSQCLKQLKKAASIAMATRRCSKLPFSLWDFSDCLTGSWGCLHKKHNRRLAARMCALHQARSLWKHLGSQQINPIIRLQSACIRRTITGSSPNKWVCPQPPASLQPPSRQVSAITFVTRAQSWGMTLNKVALANEQSYERSYSVAPLFVPEPGLCTALT